MAPMNNANNHVPSVINVNDILIITTIITTIATIITSYY